MSAVILVTVLFLLLITPLRLKVQVYFNVENKKVYFNVNLLNLKLLGGYAKLSKFGVVVHLSKNKAIILPFTALDVRKRFNLTSDFKIYSVYNVLEVGECEKNMPYFVIGFIENVLLTTIFAVKSYDKFWIKLKNNVLIYKEESMFKLNCEIIILFNLLAVVVAFVKIFIGKIIDGNK